MFFKALLLALIPAVLAVDHPVTIGEGNTLTFTPDQVIADIGDTLTFTV
jgi:plastocyanin